MNSINEIAKYKYEHNNNSPVNLDEYIIIYDESLDERYLLFKLYNGLSEHLTHAECEIRIFNSNDFLVEDIKFSFDGNFDSNEYFVPELKLKVNSEITYIKFDIIVLKFENLMYKDGQIKRIPKAMDDFITKDNPSKELYKKQNKWTKKKDKLDYKSTKKKVKKDNKRKYITNVTKDYRTKIHIILTIIFGILTVAYFVGALILYVMTTNVISDSNNDYRIYEDKQNVMLVSNYNQAKKVIIPDKVDDKNVIRIDDYAFKDNKVVEEIVLPANANITIGNEAFSGCENLKTITNSESITSIGKYAFKGTNVNLSDLPNVYYIGEYAFPENNITELNAPNAELDNNSLYGFKSLKTLSYKRIKGNTLLDTFGDIKYSASTLTKIVTYNDITVNQLEGYDKVNKVFLYGSDTSFRSKLLNNNKITYLRLNGNSKSVSERIGSSTINNFNLDILHINLQNNYKNDILKDMIVKTLVIEGNTLSTDLLLSNAKVNTLYICNNVNYSMTDFDKILKNGYIKNIVFEGEKPKNITSSLVSGNVTRTSLGIEK